MANLHRRIKWQIKGAVKKLKRGEIPVPPDPKVASPDEEKQFIEEMKVHRRRVRADLERLSSAGSRQGHKKRLRLDEELGRLNELLKGTD